MKSDVTTFELSTPKTLADALATLAREPGVWRPIAGGTDVMVMLAAGKLPHARWMSLWGLPELRGITVAKEHVTIGALATYTEVQRNETVRVELPMLVQAGSETGGVAIQNRGTIGGNIANASPAADSPPALLAYGAELELVSARGSRWVPYDGFHTGYKTMILAADEIIARVRLPRFESTRVHFYRKVGPRKAQAISKVCFAGCAILDGAKVVDVKIGMGGVAPIIPRCRAAERGVAAGSLAEAKAGLAKDIRPIDDVRSTARYRSKVAENLLVDFALRVSHAAR